MHMTSYFGYKIALHKNDKSKRASYRFARNSSVVYDRSYYEFIFIT